jgi:AcrR family transcriptional regulator
LLDVARALVVEQGPSGVSMGTVAERAQVTRALVYKHFANREELLAALYRREAIALDRALRREVAAAPEGFDAKLRVFVHAVLDAVGTHGPLFEPLRPFGADADFRREQRSWDRKTVSYFSALAAEAHGIDESVARPAVAIVLSGIDALIAGLSEDPGDEHRALLEDLFVEMATAALAHLASSHRCRRDA